MNLRILKKLSKRAAPLLPLIGDNREQFRAAHARAGDNYHGFRIMDRTDWERGSCHQTYKPSDWEPDIVYKTRSGRPMVMGPPAHPRKGTIMVGATSGYFEPEWDEQCAYAALCDLVYANFTDWEQAWREESTPRVTRPLHSVSRIFRAADEMARELQGGAA